MYEGDFGFVDRRINARAYHAEWFFLLRGLRYKMFFTSII